MVGLICRRAGGGVTEGLASVDVGLSGRGATPWTHNHGNGECAMASPCRVGKVNQ